MPALTFDDIQKPLNLKAYAVPVPEFGDGLEAWIGELSADERDARMEVGWAEHKKERGNDSQVGARAWIAAACWCEGPERAFVCGDVGAIAMAAEKLGQWGAKVVTRMVAKAQEVNAFGEEEIEELEKN